ncbi:hypothetical protein M440DRAFT_1014581 [Trichoderma longibrachiatum ATCC 18648]|uniref:Uncharacterized protein n=1 Tax=Trichoderma longibrachiatum ATCC 18648 TaxID=983965 RepID=A0A2T4CIQ6_TRILO|nr:hypothetical protein M440DRAFT_1014581 [Trichoderma longibrachiatum ATCC 18648]
MYQRCHVSLGLPSSVTLFCTTVGQLVSRSVMTSCPQSRPRSTPMKQELMHHCPSPIFNLSQ